MPTGVYKHKPHSEKTKRKIGSANSIALRGRKRSEETKRKMRLRVGEKSPNWKGDSIGYRGIHHWIRRKLGEPTYCKFCGKKKTTPKSIHWANKSGEYKRDLTDWISLCAKCHKKYDKEGKVALSKIYNYKIMTINELREKINELLEQYEEANEEKGSEDKENEEESKESEESKE